MQLSRMPGILWSSQFHINQVHVKCAGEVATHSLRKLKASWVRARYTPSLSCVGDLGLTWWQLVLFIGARTGCQAHEIPKACGGGLPEELLGCEVGGREVCPEEPSPEGSHWQWKQTQASGSLGVAGESSQAGGKPGKARRWESRVGGDQDCLWGQQRPRPPPPA